MCAMQRPDPFQPNQPPQPPQPENQEPQNSFRWDLYVGVPLTVALFLWFISGLKVGFAFSDLAALLGVTRMNRYVFLGALGVVCVTALSIVKWIKRR